MVVKTVGVIVQWPWTAAGTIVVALVFGLAEWRTYRDKPQLAQTAPAPAAAPRGSDRRSWLRGGLTAVGLAAALTGLAFLGALFVFFVFLVVVVL